jgi:molybdopterin molybdotransferase
MISFEKAYDIVISNADLVGVERVPLQLALNRVLAEDIFSDMDMPPFDKSAVDGFAYHSVGTHGNVPTVVETPGNSSPRYGAPLQIIETIPAGTVPVKTVGPGECSRIMTGAMIPQGAEGVIMVEDTELRPDGSVRFMKEISSKNICYQGEDIKKGAKVLSAGDRIGAAHIAVLAAVGATEPLVSKLARVAVISTGDELVEPDEKPSGAMIRNSNAMQLMAQLMQVPAIPAYLGIARDEGESIRILLNKALEENDMVLLTGGVSMGDFDFVPAIMQEAGVEILFKSVAIQPGRPTVFGRKGDKLVFGLPGNPVSSFVLFEVMVKPVLLKMMGHDDQSKLISLPMAQDFIRRKSSRKSLIPVRIEKGEIHPVVYHGSAHINAYATAHAILMLDIGVTELKKGEHANVRLL